MLDARADTDSLSDGHGTLLVLFLECLKHDRQNFKFKDIIILLLSRGADVKVSPVPLEYNAVHPSWQNPLITAMLTWQDDIVAALLQYGAIVEAKEEIYGTPLQLVPQLDCPEIFCRLVDDGANIYFRDVRGSLTNIATFRHSTGVIQELLCMENGDGSNDPPSASSMFESLDCKLRD